MEKNRLKEKLKNGEPAIGTFLRMGAISAEVFGRTDWDFVIIDVEHGVHTMEDVSNMIRAAKAVGISSIVRTPGTAPVLVQRALDAGADGVQVPQLTSIDEVKAAVQGARYYPLGNRGACAYSAATEYSTVPFDRHVETSNREVLVAIHMENVWAADHIDEILECSGIDVVFCGPWDLSQSLGIPGQTSDSRVTDRIDRVIEACSAKGVGTGIFVQHPDQVEHWLKKGVRYIACSVDVGLLADVAAQNAAELRRNIAAFKKEEKELLTNAY